MLNCVIIDDEQPARKLLENYCKKIKGLQVVESYKSPFAAHALLKEGNIDVLFLDIQMPEISGLDFLKTVVLPSTKVIFTTAYRDYALDGFNLDAIDYLLKPIAFPRFYKAVEKVKQIHSITKNTEVKTEFLLLKSGKKQYRVPISEIIYIKSENEYLSYFTKKQGKLMVYGALKDAIDSFSSYSNFVRIHRSYIINTDYIEYVEGNRVIIQGASFSISESYKTIFFTLWK
jgi:DNA-binding LytR/AlgR family response regulator